MTDHPCRCTPNVICNACLGGYHRDCEHCLRLCTQAVEVRRAMDGTHESDG